MAKSKRYTSCLNESRNQQPGNRILLHIKRNELISLSKYIMKMRAAFQKRPKRIFFVSCRMEVFLARFVHALACGKTDHCAQ